MSFQNGNCDEYGWYGFCRKKYSNLDHLRSLPAPPGGQVQRQNSQKSESPEPSVSLGSQRFSPQNAAEPSPGNVEYLHQFLRNLRNWDVNDLQKGGDVFLRHDPLDGCRLETLHTQLHGAGGS